MVLVWAQSSLFWFTVAWLVAIRFGACGVVGCVGCCMGASSGEFFCLCCRLVAYSVCGRVLYFMVVSVASVVVLFILAILDSGC